MSNDAGWLYSNRLTELALKTQFELMLLGHSWKQYMNAPKTHEEFDAAYQKVFEAGGDYYDLMDQLDIPEAEKNNYIHHYEDAWIELHAIDVGEYPHDGSEDEKWAYVQKKIDAIENYKEDHPNYPKEIREACAVSLMQKLMCQSLFIRVMDSLDGKPMLIQEYALCL